METHAKHMESAKVKGDALEKGKENDFYRGILHYGLCDIEEKARRELP